MAGHLPNPDASPDRTAGGGYLWAIGTVALSTAIGWPFYHGLGATGPESAHHWLSNTNVLMLYLLGVLWVATRHGRGPATLASVLAVAAFDFCFVPPYFRFAVDDTQYLVMFGVMLLTALTISTLTDRVRRQGIERARLAGEAREAWERVEAEFMRNTLLSSVSHDLRTPLAAITGAASSLVQDEHALPVGARRALAETIVGESERMERIINNLLDMTRLESGGLVVKKEWQPLQEVVGAALRHLSKRLAGRAVTTDLPADLPMAPLDAVAIEQVLANLLDNAAEYTPAGSAIDVGARAEGGVVLVSVADRGPGLPSGDPRRVFEKFFRAHGDGEAGGGGRRGIGLGLAICKGLVAAHGGTIDAANRPGGGAVFTFRLPIDGVPPTVDCHD
jgi:two-component system sensor histidine kinase KdpD